MSYTSEKRDDKFRMEVGKHRNFNYVSDVKVDKRYQTYFEYLVNSEDFNKDIIKIRETFKIPRDGISEYPLDKDIDPKTIKEFNEDNFDFHIPDSISLQENYLNSIFELLDKYNLNGSWIYIVEEYLVFNHYDRTILGNGYEIIDIRYYKENGYDIMENDTFKTLPIAIFIDQYSSKTELIDLINKIYDQKIKPIQNKYKDQRNKMIKIKMIKNKLIDIYNFIKENIDLPTKELTNQINKKFKLDWDYTRTNKIIREKGYKKLKNK